MSAKAILITLAGSFVLSSVATAQQTVLKSENAGVSSVSLKCEIHFSSENKIVLTHSEAFELSDKNDPISLIQLTSNGIAAHALVVHADATVSFSATELAPDAKPVGVGASLVKGGIFLTTLRLEGNRTINGKQIQEAVFGCKVIDLK